MLLAEVQDLIAELVCPFILNGLIMSESRQPWRKLAGFGILEVAILPTVYIITKYYSILWYIIVKKKSVSSLFNPISLLQASSDRIPLYR